MRVLVVINPNASRAKAALPRLTAWYARQAEVTLLETKGHDAMRQALRQFGDGVDRIVIGGGDGTISAALPSLLQHGKPLAVLPLGTANDFARTLALPDNPIAAAQLSLGGREHLIDLGVVNDRLFLNVASIGLASKVSKAQSKDRKRLWHRLSYALSFRDAIRDAKPIYVQIALDGQPNWKGMVHQVSVGNGRYHGGGLIVAEDAAIDDGKLNLYAVRPGTLLQLLACVTSLKFGFGGELEVMKRRTAEEVLITTSKPRPVNVDGDIRTETPAAFSIRRKALTVVIPEHLPANYRGLVNVDSGDLASRR